MLSLRTLIVASVLGILPGCALGDGEDAAQGDEQAVTSTSPSRLTPKAKELWTIYVNNTIGSTRIQEGCKPRDVVPPANVEYRGVIILVHGYSACPQQFDELARSLSAAGYEVLLPLMPGHGHVATKAVTTVGGHFQTSEPFRDDIIDLPGVSTRNRYRDFALTMNQIARAATGTKVIGGLSVGGAVAARAAVEDPSLYARALLISPFFQATGRFVRDAVYAADHLLPSTRISWGAGCIEERTQPHPRAGICQFAIDNLQASIQFGQETLTMVGKIKNPVQVVGVEDDQAADNAAQAKAIGLVRGKACYFRKPATHSLLSRFDSPHDDKFWLKAALAGTSAYLTEGTPLPTAEPSTEKPFLRCSTD